MSDAFGASWYRVAELRPRLRLHADIHRHHLRGVTSYVLQDHQSGRHFRVSAAANMMLCLMDGRRTADEILRIAARRLGAERPTQGDVVRLLTQLHQADLLVSPLPPDGGELDRRAERSRRRRMLLPVRNPLALRLPLWDPDRFLTATAPLLAPVRGAPLALGWFALVATGLLLAALNWQALAANIEDRAFSLGNIVLLLLIYPAIKLLHEAGHAYAVKLAGGEVHEVGVMLLVLFPVPYVDASSANGFPSARARMLVDAAGILVELAIAGAAAILWTLLPPGDLRSTAASVMLLCSVSTLLFNGNPLLRFDGYYLLSDALGIPNLDARSKAHLRRLLKRRLLGLDTGPAPAAAPGERVWLLVYGVGSTVYRIGVSLAVALVVATKLFALGVALALWSVTQMTILPIVRGLRYLGHGHELRGVRPRAIRRPAAAGACVALALFAWPVPLTVASRGMVTVPEQATVRAGGDGFVSDLLAAPGAAVAAGTPLVRIDDPVAAAQIAVYGADVAMRQAEFNASDVIDRVQSRLAHAELDRTAAVLANATARGRARLARAGIAGRWAVPEPAHLVGRYVREGDVLGYLLGRADLSIRIVVPQSSVDRIRRRTRAVAIRFVDGTTVRGRIERAVPSALDEVQGDALTRAGGGPIVLDPTAEHHDRPLGRWFAFVIVPAVPQPAESIGEHADVRLDLGREPVGFRVLRAARNLVLDVLHV